MKFQKHENIMVDIQKSLEMTDKRRKLISEASKDHLPSTYAVNELSKAIHPGFIKAKIKEVRDSGRNIKTFVFESISENKRFPYFRAGQYVTLSTQIDDSFVTRAYSIASSPKQALEGILELAIQKVRFFSSYLFDEAKVGDEFFVGEPSGDFYYDNLRDRNHIVCIAGGTGVTPFISMMKSIMEGSSSHKLTLIYGVRTLKDSLVKEEEYVHPDIKIVHVLSEEVKEGYKQGFINQDILSEYVDNSCNVFMCGPEGMYKFVKGELDKLGFDKTRIRQEHNAVVSREVDEVKIYKLTVHIRDEVYVVDARNDEPIISAMERGGVKAPSRCRSGSCGFCHSRLISGKYHVNKENEFRRQADFKFNFIHPCCTFPESDMEIEVPILDL